MLSPTDVHLVSGFLLLVSKANPVQVELGSMVYDVAGGAERDVDVTFITQSDDGLTHCLAGFEVKKHTRPLDETHVEQLTRKMQDMPSIGVPGIVSASGYTKPALKKCAYHGVKPLTLKRWDPTIPHFEHISFENMGNVTVLETGWINAPNVTFTVAGIFGSGASVVTELLDERGEKHKLSSLQSLVDELIKQVPNAIEQNHPGIFDDLAPHPVHEVITLDDAPWMSVDGRLVQIEAMRIEGIVQRREHRIIPDYKVLSDEETGAPFTGCLLSDSPTGHLFGLLVTSRDRSLQVFALTPEQRALRTIRRFPLGSSSSTA